MEPPLFFLDGPLLQKRNLYLLDNIQISSKNVNSPNLHQKVHASHPLKYYLWFEIKFIVFYFFSPFSFEGANKKAQNKIMSLFDLTSTQQIIKGLKLLHPSNYHKLYFLILYPTLWFVFLFSFHFSNADIRFKNESIYLLDREIQIHNMNNNLPSDFYTSFLIYTTIIAREEN